MSLTSSMYSGVSGLTNLGNAMQVIGDNISNVNTLGFKADQYSFQDLLSQTIATQAGTAQVGSGMALGGVTASFTQGSFQSTGNPTDMAIGGEGFFIVRDPKSEQDYYTRAGNFNFNKDGLLTNPQGYVVQGWKLDPNTSQDIGSVTDIKLASFTSPPKLSTKVSMITNLDAGSISQSPVLSNTWDAAASTPIAGTSYQYQSVVKVYDSLGSTHDITVYYDKGEGNTWEYLITCNPSEDQRNLVQGTAGQGLLARGTITFNPSSGTIQNMTMSQFTGLVGNVKPGGNLTPGEVSFKVNSYGAITAADRGLTLQYQPTPPPAGITPVNGWYLTDPAGTATILPSSNASKVDISLSGGTTADLTLNLTTPAQNGDSVTFDINDPKQINVQNVTNVTYGPTTATGITPQDNTTVTINNPEALIANDTGIKLAYATGTDSWTATWGTYYTASTVNGDKNQVQVDLDGDGTPDVTYTFTKPLTEDGSTITFDVTGTAAWSPAADTQPDANGFYQFNADFLGGGPGVTEMPIEFDIGTKNSGTGTFTNESLTTTEYARASTTTFQNADGYGAGDLQSVDVSIDGAITGNFSNGQLIPLYRVSLAKFLNNNGLSKQGGNLFRETLQSGTAITNQPGTNGLGSVSPNSLEQSNVDIATEFVNMISGQRAFQANSKIITTVDQMLTNVIQMKQ